MSSVMDSERAGYLIQLVMGSRSESRQLDPHLQAGCLGVLKHGIEARREDSMLAPRQG
jgi:hypothetical protein